MVSAWGVTCDLDSDDDFRSGCRTSVTTTDKSPFQDYTHPDDKRARHEGSYELRGTDNIQ